MNMTGTRGVVITVSSPGDDPDRRDRPPLSAGRPAAELSGRAMSRFWRSRGGRLLLLPGSALGSRSASAGVVLRRSALLCVWPFRWSGSIVAGQGCGLGFMACKRSGVRIPVAHFVIYPQVRDIFEAPTWAHA